MWPIGLDDLDFDEAIAFFRDLLDLTKDEEKDLLERAGKHGFTVAGVAQLDLVHEVWRALDKAIADGTTLEDFKAAVGDKLEAAWSGTVKAPGARIETIFRTNVQVAYSAGRYTQATDPDVSSDRPYWLYDAVLDSRTTPTCRACDGTVLPADDAWWKTHIPPLHHNCRSTFITLTREQAEARGITTKPPKHVADDGFGAPPTAPPWEPDKADYPDELWSEFEKKKGD